MAYIYSITDTWNSAGTTFTGIGLNVTDTASAAGSLLMDLQVGGSSVFNVGKTILRGPAGSVLAAGAPGISFQGFSTHGFGVNANNLAVWVSGIIALNITDRSLGAGEFRVPNDYRFSFSSASNNNAAADTILTRRAAANLRLGAPDAAAPVAQTLSVQSVVAGTSNTAGANLTITGSQGTGTGAGGSIIFQVAPAGGSGTAQNALVTSLALESTGVNRLYSSGAASHGISGVNGFSIIATGGTNPLWSMENGITYQRSNATINWSSGAGVPGTVDLTIARDAANTLALRNGTNPQTFNLYGTYTDASNYERIRIVTGGSYELICEAAGTGAARGLQLKAGTGNNLSFGGNGGVQWRVNFSGHLEAITDNTYDIGAAGANRPRAIYVAGQALFGTNAGFTSGGNLRMGNSFGYIIPNADGVFQLSNFAATDFGRLQFGGTTSSFPALKRSTTFIQARLADDSAFAGFAAANVQAATAYTVAGLPTPSTGMMARVTDATAPTVGTTVVGGGAAAALVWYNGANWTVIGV